MGKIRWYKRDPDAALQGMMALSLEERGAYNTVLDLIYSNDGSVVDDDRFIAGWLRVDVRVWKRIRERLLSLQKLYLVDGSLRNSRADREVDEALHRVASARDAGRISASKRNGKFNGTKDIASTTVEQPFELSTTTPTEERIATAIPKKKRRSAIDPDWQPDEQDRAFAEQRGVSHVEQRDPFVNHHVAKGTLSADWHASWRTWCLNAVKFAAERGGGRGGKSGGLTGFASVLFDEVGGRGFGRVDEATVLDERGDPVGEVAPFPRRGAAAAR